MPIKKTTTKAAATKKDALKKLTVPALRAKAKRAGIKLSKTDGSQKTKAQLVLALDKVPAPKKKATTRRRPASTSQVGASDKRRDAKRPALPPGKRRSASGRVYYERRANRSDINQTGKGQLLGNKTPNMYIDELVYFLWTDYFSHDRQTDFFYAISQIVDGMVTYYSDAAQIVSDLQYYDWSDNEFGMEPKNISEVAYLALIDRQYDVMERLSKKYNLYNDI